MATDIVAQLADSLAKTAVEDGELSYKGQGRKLDDAQSGECKHFIIQSTSLNFLNSLPFLILCLLSWILNLTTLFLQWRIW